MTRDAPARRTLLDKLRRRITREGPIGVDAFMTAALFDPDHGRYAAGQPVGAHGDFTTSPEISQIFGELLGLWAAQVWADMGAPDPVILAELGPGRGVLMADALRAAKVRPDFLAAARLHLVEASAPLKAEQAARLQTHAPVWSDAVDALPDGPMILTANEFLDCLPVRQFVFQGGVWRERRVGVHDDALAFTTGEETFTIEALTPAPPGGAPEDGAIIEICEPAQALARTLGERTARSPSHALFIDYGHARPGYGETLQALRHHKPVDVLAAPGTADVTAHVDFAAFARAAERAGAAVHGPIGQGRFLKALGADARARALIAAVPDRGREIMAGALRLTDPRAMGELFKVLCLSSPQSPAPPGF